MSVWPSLQLALTLSDQKESTLNTGVNNVQDFSQYEGYYP